MQDALFIHILMDMFHQELLCQRILMTDILKIDEDVVPRFPKHVKFK